MTFHPNALPTVRSLSEDLNDAKEDVEHLQAIVEAQSDIISYYEDETERSCFTDAEIPEALREAEQAREAAEAARKSTNADA